MYNIDNSKLDQLFLNKCRKGDLRIMKQMMKLFSININTKDRENCTPLIIACRKGFVNIVRFLLTNPNTNTSVCDKNGFSALECAIWISNEEIVDLLLETNQFDADKKIMNGIFKNETPLSISMMRNNKNIISKLETISTISFIKSVTNDKND